MTGIRLLALLKKSYWKNVNLIFMDLLILRRSVMTLPLEIIFGEKNLLEGEKSTVHPIKVRFRLSKLRKIVTYCSVWNLGF